MTSYEVSRQIEAVGTGQASTTSTAKSSVAEAVSEAIAAAGDVAVETDAVEVFEFPSGPFDPYRVTVLTTIIATVEADDESAALERGRERIEAALADADVDEWEYAGPAELEAPA